MVSANTIQFFKNLAQYDYENKYYDFHNDYKCTDVFFSEKTLSLTFKKLIEKESFINLKFFNAEITMIDFCNIISIESLTIDNIYRGRLERNGMLVEVSGDEKAYFYLEFYEGQKLEFWAEGMGIE